MKDRAIEIMNVLSANGHIAVFAGGAVRDSLLGKTPKDFDIATCAVPARVKELFPHHVADGESHGVIKVITGNIVIDVATLREDSSYSDGRRPDSVIFTNCLESDSNRRDFTVNALFMTAEGTIIDFHKGQEDLKNNHLRAVGKAADRLAEDKLRMLRAARFAGQLNFSVCKELLSAIEANAAEVLVCSHERITDEIFKILNLPFGSFQNSLSVLLETKLFDVIFPEIAILRGVMQDCIHHPGSDQDVFNHSLGVMIETKRQNADAETVFAALHHDIGKLTCQQHYTDAEGRARVGNRGHAEVGARMVKPITDRFKLSNSQSEKIIELVAQHMRAHEGQKMKKSTLVQFLRNPHIQSIIQLQHADGLNSAHKDKTLKGFYTEALANLQLEIVSKPLLSGKDLIAAGMQPGPTFAEVMKKVRVLQDEGTIKTKKEAIKVALTLV